MPFGEYDKLTLDRIVEYRIRIQGILNKGDRDWTGGEILPRKDGTTVIHGRYDQASLHGVLGWIYSRGLPLISVVPAGDGRE